MIRELIFIIVVYLLIVFILPLFLFPNHLFKTRIRKTQFLKKFAKKFKGNSKEKTLRNIYDYIITNYDGFNQAYNLFFLPYKHFYTSVERIVLKKQFLPCHVHNLVLITLAINTGQFQEKDFERREVMGITGVLHQYVLVKLNTKTVKVDSFYKIYEQ
ncbi:MAG: hypothetical protein KKE50_03605 [Nanoarchaeota archaeon]|nr:hypothetical protein [Nanoarchaeota archaeon]